jgi:hypothetical protein
MSDEECKSTCSDVSDTENKVPLAMVARDKRVSKLNSKFCDYEVLSEKENNALAKPLTPLTKRRPQFKRDRNLVGPFEPTMLLPDNPYNLKPDASCGFKVGDRVCIKDWYESPGKLQRQTTLVYD